MYQRPIQIIREARGCNIRHTANALGICKPKEYEAWEQGWGHIGWTPERRALALDLFGPDADPDGQPRYSKQYGVEYVILAESNDQALVWTLTDFCTAHRMSKRAFIQDQHGWWRLVKTRQVETFIQTPETMAEVPPLCKRMPDGVPLLVGEVYRVPRVKWDNIRFRCPSCGKEHIHNAPAPGAVEHRIAHCGGPGLFKQSGYYITSAL